jgi:hypothetical protein
MPRECSAAALSAKVRSEMYTRGTISEACPPPLGGAADDADGFAEKEVEAQMDIDWRVRELELDADADHGPERTGMFVFWRVRVWKPEGW